MTLRAEDGARGLLAFALESMRRMQLPSGLFCEEVVAGDGAPRGENLRYSLMSLLGLLKAERAGYDHGYDLDRILVALDGRVDDPSLRPGDYGLYLWVDALTGRTNEAVLLERLAAALAREGGLPRREGMEAGWIVTGLAHQVAAGSNGSTRPLLESSLEHLIARQDPASGLFRHSGDGSFRSRFPNFATQIYAVLALATVAKLGLAGGDRAAEAARRASERLQALQMADGGWPWLYDVESGQVVERYEVYTVHQDAMAPMGLLELAEATGDPAHADAALRGLGWIHGRNELGASMLDARDGILYRSIRRRRPWDRLLLYANTGASKLSGAGRVVPSGGPLELNRTDRPYHLGWVLQAWCERENLPARA